MLNLLTIIPDSHDSTSFYRGIGPLAELRKQMPLNIIQPSQIYWDTLKLADAIFLQRPFAVNHLSIAQMARSQNLPVWIDYDDDLLNVPQHNPCAQFYGKDAQEIIAKICKIASVISVSTEQCKAVYSQFNDKIITIPNAFDNQLFDFNLEQSDTNFSVLWRGSKTHALDLNIAAEGCIQAAKKFPKLHWIFFGDTPWFAHYMPNFANITIMPPIDPIEYFQTIKILKPRYMIVPLEDNAFNCAKSNIAWIEGTYAGSAILAPNFDEWKRPGIENYQNFTASLLSWLEKDETYLREQNKLSKHFIAQKLLLTKVNVLRKTLLEGIINGRS